MRPVRRIIPTVLALSLSAYSSAVMAQDQPTVFVHGLTGSASTWDGMRPYLEAQLHISGISPTLGWSNLYAQQALSLHSTLSGFSNVISVAHSNGGVVTRRYLTSSEAPRINRHVSINSPHHGAVLAQSALNGQIGNFANDLYDAIVQPVYYYWARDTYFQNVFIGLSYAFELLTGALGYADSWVGGIGYGSAFLMQQLFGFVPSVLSDMVPGSPVLASQLSASALQLEAVRAPVRFSISNELDPNMQPYSIYLGNPGAVQNGIFSVIAFAEFMYWHYSEHADSELRQMAWLWQRLAVTLATTPVRWSQLNGSYINPTQLWKNDGVVPWSSSRYPGGDWFDMPASQFPQVPHTAQTTSPAVAAAVRQVLTQEMGVVVRGAPFTAGVLGPSLVAPGSTCTFSASVSGGSPPFTYQWFVNQVPVSQAASMAWTFGGFSSEVAVTVTDALNASRSASVSVFVDPYASGCGW